MIHYITGKLGFSRTGSFIFQDRTQTVGLITLQKKPYNSGLEGTALISDISRNYPPIPPRPARYYEGKY